MRRLTKVVFPAPLCPSKLFNNEFDQVTHHIAYHMISPSPMEKLTLSRAVKSPNTFLSPIARIVCYMKMIKYRTW